MDLPPAQMPRRHDNELERVSKIREQDEVEAQNQLLRAQRDARIYNEDIEPEHETEQFCSCSICDYRRFKTKRSGIHDLWSRATKYPGEKTYNDLYGGSWSDPYANVTSPYFKAPYRNPCITSDNYRANVLETIQINNRLNQESQMRIDSLEPRQSIWPFAASDDFAPAKHTGGFLANLLHHSDGHKLKVESGIKCDEDLANAILREEGQRWWDADTRRIVATYQENVGMTRKIADLRENQPIQYLHLLRAGYFEPIPTRWSEQASNPLKFEINAAGGWRGITPAWRGYEDLAEERLYWLQMARDRMARAVPPPAEYFDPRDQCHIQHTSKGYSNQVVQTEFTPFDDAEVPSDDTMILLDVSGSMDFQPQRPRYENLLITGYDYTTQPKNKDVAKAIVRRFTQAMAKHDHHRKQSGYDLVTFSSQAKYVGRLSNASFEYVWQNVQVGGGTRVMTGWQKVKELHFKKHSQSATHHPVL
ncbi:hypothetical protein RQP46_007150 [Phenoliferia psychrophenolica]